jgi:rRNA maturation endonuclease Nob1
MYNTISKNSTDLNKNINMYKRNDNKIKAELNLPLNNNFKSKPSKEGMKNIDTNQKNITMNDINSMLSDTDIRVLQENYSYIFWSVLAIGLLTVTINQIKK